VNRRGAEDAEARGRLAEPEKALNGLTEAVIGAAIEVHRNLGPGFLESFYEEALCLELAARGIPFVRQAAFPVLYKGTPIGETRVDMLVDDRVLVELKATASYASIHLAQVLSYLSATGLTLGLLINFNVLSLRHGIRRVVRTPSLQTISRSASSATLQASRKEST